MNTSDLKISLRRGDSPLEGVSAELRSATYFWSPVSQLSTAPISLARTCAARFYKRLSYRRGTARRAMSVEILSTAAQLYEKSRLKWLAISESP